MSCIADAHVAGSFLLLTGIGSEWEVARRIVLPYTRAGVVGDVMLGLILFAITFVVLAAAKLMLIRKARQEGAK